MINDPRNQVFWSNFCSLWIFEKPFWDPKKVIFSTFSKLFWSCLGSLYALSLKGLLFSVFLALNVDKSPRKCRFSVKINVTTNCISLLRSRTSSSMRKILRIMINTDERMGVFFLGSCSVRALFWFTTRTHSFAFGASRQFC